MTKVRRIAGLSFDEGRILVDDRGWTGLVDAAADPDPEHFATAVGAPAPGDVSAELHWTIRAHIEATLGVELAGRSSDGTAVGASASSDGERGLLLLDTRPGRWSSGGEPVITPRQSRQVLPVLGRMLPVLMLDLMQVWPTRGLGFERPEKLSIAEVTSVLWPDAGASTSRFAALLDENPWRHWRIRATCAPRGGAPVEDGIDAVVLPDGVLLIEQEGPQMLEVVEVGPVDLFARMVAMVRPGLADASG